MHAPARPSIRDVNRIRDQAGSHFPIKITNGAPLGGKTADAWKQRATNQQLRDREANMSSRQMQQTVIGRPAHVRPTQQIRIAVAESSYSLSTTGGPRVRQPRR